MKKGRIGCYLLFLVFVFVGTFMPEVEAKAAKIVYSGVSGSLNWSVDDTGHLLITGTGNYNEKSWLEYIDYITSATIKVDDITYCDHMFEYLSKLKTIDLSQSDFSKTETMEKMFYQCGKLEKISFGKNCNTNKVNSMHGMFDGCMALKEIDIQYLDTDNVSDFTSMFYNCCTFKTLDLSTFDTSNATKMGCMFGWCYGLESINLSSFDTSHVEEMYDMFNGCFFTELDLSNFDMSSVKEGYVDNMLSSAHQLGRLKTPRNVKVDIALKDNRVWKSTSGKVYTSLPRDSSKSILLLKIGEPQEVIIRDGKQIVVDDYGVRIATTGFVKVKINYYYVEDGVVQKVTTLIKNGSEYWYVKDGIFTKTTTLIKYNNIYYYVKDGIYTKATTLVNYNNKYWYVKNGIFCKDTTLVKYGSNYWYVSGGQLQRVTTLVKYGDKYYYVQNGKHVKATGLTKYGNDYWYVKNGVLYRTTTIVKQGGKYYLVYRGKWHRTYNGTYVWNGVRWKIVKGVVTGRA